MQLPTPNLSHSPNLILISSQNRTAAMSNLLRRATVVINTNSSASMFLLYRKLSPVHLPRFRETFHSMTLDSSRVWFCKTLISSSPSESSTTMLSSDKFSIFQFGPCFCYFRALVGEKIKREK
jgi:hypothetical protein